jgi:hypothetical protein
MDMNNRLSTESIKSSIEYTKGKLEGQKETIDFYKEVGANKDFSWEQSQVDLFENDIQNLTDLLQNGPKETEGLKVRVTEYKGNVVVETLGSSDFDQDFSPAGGGSIGCSLHNNERLGISNEAVEAIRKLKRVGDSIGDFMNGESDYLCWIGGAFSIKDTSCVVSRDFKMPKGYVVIDNETSDKAKEEIDSKVEEGDIEYKDLPHSVWIEIRESTTRTDPGEGKPFEHTSDGYYTLNVKIHKKYYNETDYKVVNAPEGTIRDCQMYAGDYTGKKYQLTDDNFKEIKGLAEACFEGMTGKIKHDYFQDMEVTGFKIPKDEVMSFVNGLFNVGFDNNIMNPRMDYWRMSIEASVDEIKKALKTFKRA